MNHKIQINLLFFIFCFLDDYGTYSTTVIYLLFKSVDKFCYFISLFFKLNIKYY